MTSAEGVGGAARFGRIGNRSRAFSSEPSSSSHRWRCFAKARSRCENATRKKPGATFRSRRVRKCSRRRSRHPAPPAPRHRSLLLASPPGLGSVEAVHSSSNNGARESGSGGARPNRRRRFSPGQACAATFAGIARAMSRGGVARQGWSAPPGRPLGRSTARAPGRRPRARSWRIRPWSDNDLHVKTR